MSYNFIMKNVGKAQQSGTHPADEKYSANCSRI